MDHLLTCIVFKIFNCLLKFNLFFIFVIHNIQWHTILYHLIIEYKLSCILVEHLDIDTLIFDTIISKRVAKTVKRNKDFQILFSKFAFGRLINSEHYMNNWLKYRQVHGNDMFNFQYEPKTSSFSMSLLDDDEQMNDNDEDIL